MTKEMGETYVNIIENITTWQGEGADCGTRMILLRFKDCDRVVNKNPCYFCDTLVKMRTSASCSISLESIQEILIHEKCGLMITGGEPLWDTNLRQTLSLLNLNYPICNIESNGYNLTRFISSAPMNKPWRLMYSPKIFNSDDYKKASELINAILMNKNLNERIFFKIVAEDNDFIKDLMYKLDSANANNRVYVMPQGKNIDELMKNVPLAFDMAEEFKFNFSSREHLIYGFI